MAADGLTTMPSDLSPAEAASRLEAEIKNRNLTIFARIDHAAGAQAVGLALRPTEVIIFGNARGGTPLMQDQQTVGIDLPLKILVWQDQAGRTWLSYNDPQWLARRHGLEASSDETAQALSQVLGAIARAAAPVGHSGR